VRRLAEWARQFDRLSVSASDWPVPASDVTIHYSPGWRRVLLVAGLLLIGCGAIWALVVGNPVPVFLPIFFTVGLGVWGGGLDSLPLLEPLLAQAAVRAAETLGVKERSGHWRIDGEPARAVGPGLIKLNDLALARADQLGFARIERERQLIAAAPPEVRAYLRPILTAQAHRDEPLEVDTSSHVEGDPWPTLDTGNLQWPQLGDGQTEVRRPPL